MKNPLSCMCERKESMTDNEKKSKKTSESKIVFDKKNSSYIPMGQYVPVHKVPDKLSKEELSKIDAKEFLKKTSNPFEKKDFQEHKLCFYDGDYLKQQTLEKTDLYAFSGNMLVRFFKIIFFNLPVVNFLYLKLKESKIKDSISTLNSLNGSVDNYAKHFEGKSIINEQKYQQICAELIKANNIQSQIKRDILSDF